MMRYQAEQLRIKICGLTRHEDIAYVNEVQPDYIGFVFAKSRRQVTEEVAISLKRKLEETIIPIGVFVDATQEQIIRIVNSGAIGMIQLHGAESPEYVQALKNKLTCPIIKALGIKSQSEQSEKIEPKDEQRKQQKEIETYEQRKQQKKIESYEQAGISYFLFDNGSGGTGACFDWNQIPETTIPYFLAGGLNLSNITDAIARTRPFAVDLSSGVETAGFKDKEKMMQIIRRIRG